MHKPVLLEETLGYLLTDPDGAYVDGTLGGAGHTGALAARLSEKGHIYALDKDSEILQRTAKQLDLSKVTPIHADFRDIKEVLSRYGLGGVQGILLDLGVSSFQLDEKERGFSFHEDAVLDMRMDRTQALSAYDIVNGWSEQEIADVLFRYGEERYSRGIARAIVRRRAVGSISTTLDLVEVIKGSVPAAYRKEKHPARRSFQGLRVAVNQELLALQESMPQCVELLKPGGRLCIITFNSLEDRLVKQYFNELSRTCICPPGFPVCVCQVQPSLRIIKRKGIVPAAQETEGNPRARSAKLRVAEKI